LAIPPLKSLKYDLRFLVSKFN